MDNLVTEIEKIPLDGDDLQMQSMKLGNFGVRWILYDDLSKFPTLDSLFTGCPSSSGVGMESECNTIFVLLQIKNHDGAPTVGHWISLSIDASDTLQYYDPYGLSIEQDLALTGEDSGELIRLINSHNGGVDVNNVRHQAFKDEVQVCGRHCVVRSIFHNFNNEQYDKRVIQPLLKKRQIHDPDVLVSLMTAFLSKSDEVVREFFTRSTTKEISNNKLQTRSLQFRGLGGRVI